MSKRLKVINNIICENDTSGGIYASTTEGKIIKWEDRGTSAFQYNVVSKKVRSLLGKVLTVIDASYTNEKQLKAVKDLIRNHFSDELSDFWEMSEGSWEEIVEMSANEAIDNGTLEEVSLEEALGA